MSLAALPLRAVEPIEVAQQRPTSAMSERDLLTGYEVPAIRPCLCGGWIRAMQAARCIAEAVQAHNDSAGHTAWAIAAGWR